jgi:hypothetical protein
MNILRCPSTSVYSETSFPALPDCPLFSLPSESAYQKYARLTSKGASPKPLTTPPIEPPGRFCCRPNTHTRKPFGEGMPRPISFDSGKYQCVLVDAVQGDPRDKANRIRPSARKDRFLPGCTACRRPESSPNSPSVAGSFHTSRAVDANACRPWEF